MKKTRTKEIFIDVEVPHIGPNASLWAENSLKNEVKYNEYVKQKVDEFMKRRKNLRLSGAELLEVRVDGHWHATAIHRYYFQKE